MACSGKKKKIADKDEILTFLTEVMRNTELGEKDRLGAAFKLGRYIGLEEKCADENSSPYVLIYDGTQKD